MKRIFMATMIVVLSNSSMSATNFYESLSSQISRLGQAIENVDNIPVIGKLTNVLPMAVLAASLKECPLQTMMVFNGRSSQETSTLRTFLDASGQVKAKNGIVGR